MIKVTVVGSANMDLVITAPTLPRPGETVLGDAFTQVPGGKGANQAIAAVRAGASVTFIGAIGAAGQAIFGNLGLLFAIGVAVGLARENHGAAGLAGAVGYLVTTEATKLLRLSLADLTRSSAVFALSLPACTSTRATPDNADWGASARVSTDQPNIGMRSARVEPTAGKRVTECSLHKRRIER